MIVTCRRPEDLGKWRGDEDQRLTLLRQAIVDGVEYVDLEMDVAKKIPRYGPTKRVISYHNFKETPDDLEEIFGQMQDLDPDVIKLATMANSPLDNVRNAPAGVGGAHPDRRILHGGTRTAQSNPVRKVWIAMDVRDVQQRTRDGTRPIVV